MARDTLLHFVLAKHSREESVDEFVHVFYRIITLFDGWQKAPRAAESVLKWRSVVGTGSSSREEIGPTSKLCHWVSQSKGRIVMFFIAGDSQCAVWSTNMVFLFSQQAMAFANR